MNNRVAVIGGGAAGLMAAYSAAALGASVTVIEKNRIPGKKLLITGKGRCNVTNRCTPDEFIASIRSNPKFMYSAYKNFDCEDTVNFFEQRGVALKTERGNRVFPVSDRSSDIAEALKKAVISAGAKIVTATAKQLVISSGKVTGVVTDKGIFDADAVIIATGGMSYPATGSTGDGYILARQAGHSINDVYAALVPLVCAEDWCRELAGLSLRNVSVTLQQDDNKPFYSDFGELLFTHFGVSGPTVLSSSSHIKGEPRGIRMYIDLKPALTHQQLDARLLRDFELFKNKDFGNSLSKLLPASMIPVIIKLSGIPFELKVNSVTKLQRQKLVELLKALPLTITAKRPLQEAIVTGGGVNCSEINSSTMRSKLVQGLYFAGEVIDVDAYTGGFNLQIAFSTGHLAGANAAYQS